jgi:hypothetical protein
MIELTTSQLNARMQKLDEELVMCLNMFLEDTGIAVDSVLIDYNEDGYAVTLGLAFPEE